MSLWFSYISYLPLGRGEPRLGWGQCETQTCASLFSFMLLLKCEPCPCISYMEKSDLTSSITAFTNHDQEAAKSQFSRVCCIQQAPNKQFLSAGVGKQQKLHNSFNVFVVSSYKKVRLQLVPGQRKTGRALEVGDRIQPKRERNE